MNFSEDYYLTKRTLMFKPMHLFYKHTATIGRYKSVSTHKQLALLYFYGMYIKTVHDSCLCDL